MEWNDNKTVTEWNENETKTKQNQNDNVHKIYTLIEYFVIFP